MKYDMVKVEEALLALLGDGVISGHADLQRKGDHKCRIALSGKHEDGASAIASLSHRSRAFIDDWHAKWLNGDSDFVDI